MEARRWTLGIVLVAAVSLFGLVQADASPFSSYVLSDDLGNRVNGAAPDADEWETDSEPGTSDDGGGANSGGSDDGGSAGGGSDDGGSNTNSNGNGNGDGNGSKTNNGHGNNEDGVDSSNKGKSKEGMDSDPTVDDEKR